jgi:ribosome biogenesis GTPase
VKKETPLDEDDRKERPRGRLGDRSGRDKDLSRRERSMRETRALREVPDGAIVLRSSRGHAWLQGEPTERHVLLPRWAQVVAGDRVTVDSSGRIDGMVPRRTQLRRQVGVKGEQVLVANLDRVALVVGPGLLLREGFLARSLCGILAEKLEPLIVFQKVDLDADHVMAQRAGLYAALGFPVIGTSARTGEGVAELKALLAGSTTALLGQSGVGKSSLVNAMYGVSLRTGEVDAWGRGKHTTTLAVALPVEPGTLLVDLPGVREFGLATLDRSVLGAAFPEIAKISARCRYPGCTHLGEEGCAVEPAELKGRIDPERFDAYRGIVASYAAGDEGGGRG